MDAETIKKLRELANAATPGEWSVDGFNLSGVIHRPHGSESVSAWKTLANCQTSNWKADAAYIAAANPAVIISLIDALDTQSSKTETPADEVIERIASDACAESHKELGILRGSMYDAAKRAARIALSTSNPGDADGIAPTHRHKKRGSTYSLIGIGKMQAETWEDMTYQHQVTSVDMREVAVYRCTDDGSLWVRPREEFEDGRFEVLPAPPASSLREGRQS